MNKQTATGALRVLLPRLLLELQEFSMRRQKEPILKTTTDIKVFLLFLLDNIGYPIDRSTIMNIVEENTDEISLDYDECLCRLVDSEHLYYDEVDGERYYMISDKGRMVASQLYDSLDEEFRERSLRCAIRHISLSKSGARIRSFVKETASGRYTVTMEAADKFGDVMSVSVTVNSRAEAEVISKNFEAKPDGVYRGVMFSVTGKLDYIS